MTSSEIRIAVAKALGWERKPEFDYVRYSGAKWEVYAKQGERLAILEELPNFPESLDACAEAVKSMSVNFQNEFQAALNGIALKNGKLFCQLDAIHWCEAFLLTTQRDVS